jgi:hypothetical protein
MARDRDGHTRRLVLPLRPKAVDRMIGRETQNALPAHALKNNEVDRPGTATDTERVVIRMLARRAARKYLDPTAGCAKPLEHQR